jgi:demethylmenaquinone methyltransferase/2-methoxy-6-polyprenyl-1,4-benzoquinol methylase
MTDADAYVTSLMVTNPLVRPVHRAAIQALDLLPGSHGLDAGCGIGLQALLLAEAVGRAGQVTGLDLSPELLARATEIVGEAGLSKRISFREGDVSTLPFDDGTFDWAWSADCIGYGPHVQPVPLLQELGRVVRPGGTVAILAWSSQMLLPGYPLLEARLNATSSGLAPFTGESRPEAHFHRGLGWFRAAGFEDCSAQTFAGSAHAPLSESMRAALLAILQMRWPDVDAELAERDRAAYRRLCLPGSPDLILDHPDYYAFFTYSMLQARVATHREHIHGVHVEPRSREA